MGQAYEVDWTFSVTAPGSGTPSGNVTVSDGTSTCSASPATGKCNLTSTTPGSPKTITATYPGDANFSTSTSTGVSHTVNKADTTTTITNAGALGTATVVGQAYAVNYSVTVNSPGSGTPTGNVTVSDGSQTCIASVAAATCNLTSTTVGSPKTITTTYTPGDTNFNASPASAGVAHTVNKADTTAAITSDSPDPSVVGQAVTVKYTVSVTAPGGGTIPGTGSVHVTDGVDFCDGTVAAGQCSVSLSTAGTRTLTATYQGDGANYNASPASPGESHTVDTPASLSFTASVAFDSSATPADTIVRATQFVTVKLTITNSGQSGATGVTPPSMSFSATGTASTTPCGAGSPASGSIAGTGGPGPNTMSYNYSCGPVSGDGTLKFTTSGQASGKDAISGNTVSTTGSIDSNLVTVDSTPPTVTVTPASGSYTVGTTLAVNWSASDTGGAGAPPGLGTGVTCSVVIDGGAPTTNCNSSTSFGAGSHTIAVTGTDGAGNVTTVNRSYTITVDSTPPVITPTVTPAPNGAGWNNTNPTVTWSVTDPESGIASSTGCGSTTVSTETTGLVVTCSATNGAALSSSNSVTIKLDKTPPTASATPSPAANANGWNNTNVTVTFSGSDALSGIDHCDSPTTLSAEAAGQSASGTCTDKAGNMSATATASGINIDKTPPTASATPSPAANANGWNNTNVTVTFSGSDALSGIDSCDAPVTLSSEGAGQSASGKCTDKAGNMSATATASGINIDKTPPSLSGNRSPAANANGWNNVDVTATFTCTDGLSGVDVGPVTPQVVSTEGAGQSRSADCTDKAGNTANTTVNNINIDKTPPTASATPSPGPNANGWNKTDVTVTFSGSDTLSGIDSCDAPVTLSSEGAGQSASGKCTDKAGNMSATATASGINIDKAAPTLSFGTAFPAANGAGWNNTNVSVPFTPADTLSGVDFTSPAASPLVLSTEGAAVTGAVTVTDKAGNTATFTSPAVKIDKTPPTINGSRTPLANANGWNNTNVTVSFACSESLSGLAVGSPPADTLLSSEGANQSVNKTCYDVAGNSASATVSNINIDKTPPSATASASPGPNANGWNNTNVVVSFSGADALSGIDFCTSPITLSAEAAGQSASGTCTDKAGNVSLAATASNINIDKTAPSVSVTGVSNGATYTLGAVPTAGCNTTDGLSGVATSATVNVTGAVPPGVGTLTATCTGATDKAGNPQAAPASVTYYVHYASGGICDGDAGHQILQPINADGSSVFKYGSTVPVKFRVCDANGNSIGTPGVVPSNGFTVVGMAGTVASVNETIVSTTPDTAFRWDPTGQQWIFNLATSGLSKNATAVFTIMLNDGTIVGPVVGGYNVAPGKSSFQFGLK